MPARPPHRRRNRHSPGVGLPTLALCLCGVGLLLSLLARRATADCSSHNCYNHGLCNHTSQSCTCFDQFTGADCQQRKCPMGRAWISFPTANDVAHDTLFECSNMGHCDRGSGLCSCRDGWYGSACSYSRCPRNNETSAGGEECSGRGRCLTLHEAAQEQNHVTLLTATEYEHWDAHMIQGCVCDEGFTGPDCSLRSCPFGDDPGSNAQAPEVQIIDCSATGGTFTATFRGRTTGAIAYNAAAAAVQTALAALTTIYGVTVTSVNPGGSDVACDSNGAAMRATFTHNPGDVAPLVLTSSLTGGSEVLNLIQNGATSAYATGNDASVTGTREFAECSNRGTCDRATGICTCHDDFASGNRADPPVAGYDGACSFLTTGTESCTQSGYIASFTPGFSCMGHGTCATQGSSKFYCSACDVGYTGDCSLKTCPTARAWWSEASSASNAHSEVECGGVGICDRSTGTCSCLTLGSYELSSNSIFQGEACQRIACPYNSSSLSTCGNKGVCLSMEQWAAKATDGKGTVLGLTYSGGASTASWDTATLSGCFCDYFPEENRPYASAMYQGPQSWGSYPLRGYDCSRVSCATGDNPDTELDVFEQQQITCDATSGTFTITFRGFTTTNIAYNAVAMVSNEDASSSSAGTGLGESLQAKLHALFSVHPMCFSGTCTGISVSYSSGSSLCVNGGTNVATLTFESELGDLPLLAATTGSLGGTGTVAIVENVRGTKETALCSDHGVCDEDLGTCLCHKGYTSSDGNGNSGPLGDCGFRTMFATTDRAFGRYTDDDDNLVTLQTSYGTGATE